MAEYSDVPQINALYAENQQLNNAVAMIDAGGPLTTFTIGPPPPSGTEPVTTMMMAAMISVPGPNDPQLMADLRAWLVNRSNAVEAELAALGVANTPVAEKTPPTGATGATGA
jgi:hypothetical protein